MFTQLSEERSDHPIEQMSDEGEEDSEPKSGADEVVAGTVARKGETARIKEVRKNRVRE